MKAAVAWSPSSGFEVSEVRHRDPGPDDVVVRIRAAGICQTDISLAHGSFGQAFPVVLGHEGAGEIIAVGSRVSSVGVGDRVVITWVPPCGHCYFCTRGETYICAHRRSAGDQKEGPADIQAADGTPIVAGMSTATFAEEAVLPENAVLPLPDDVPFEEAALLGCAVPTGLGAALNAARIRSGETVLVVGCGAVGLSAIQGARIAGAARIVAIDPQQRRRDLATELGADVAFAPDDDELRASVDPVGFDVAIDAVGHSSTIRSAWDATRRGGRVVVVGAGKADDLVEFSALELFHAEKTLRGTFYGSSDMKRDLPRMIDLWRGGRLKLAPLIDDVVNLDALANAAVRQQSGDVLRVMVTP
ncbi:alcohol dehydrogenase [Subtercola boreus]|uniref:Alcohol dehydrogenase n=1 Tax=Subtercola boreus TaxID=120213 RepID=A0A3E0VLS0_9MICO|nr:zinc-binding dehydrogenase [Subtercola boreus]RFA10380.1 alcohol dehydrogenase [Subtercola boreus]TQL56104.1 S-(hydroxymethyl)glutathione dehydrogenase/alcohol dehydrogenase [Subtercola boreus]